VARRHVVLLAGGPGERFWPASTSRRPKPFLRVVGPGSLLEQAWARARRIATADAIWVVGAAAHEPLFRAALGDGLSPARLLLEPLRRDTAAAVALAARAVAAEDPAAVLVAIPCDQYVPDADAFAQAVERATAAAEAGFLTCLGTRPTRPETRYGYVVAGEPLAVPGAWRVMRFVEKPPREEAAHLVATGRAYWNAGIVVAAVPILWEALEACAPEVAGPLREVLTDRDAYARVPSISFDRAVLERAPNVAVVEAGFRWHDLGHWAELPRVEADAAGNFVRGPARLLGTRDSVVYNAGAEPVVVGELEGVLVAHVPGHVAAVLPLGADLRAVLGRLAETGGVPEPPSRPAWVAEDGARRPWGWEVVWSRGPRHEAAALLVEAEATAAWSCPAGWRETDWILAGDGTAAGPGGAETPLRPGSQVALGPGEALTVRAAAETTLWRLRVPAAP
jgi:mannose-1-phosphate guanylyltransferase